MRLLLVAVVAAVLCMCDSARILFVPMNYEVSHIKSMMPLAEALADKGHEVWMFSLLFRNDEALKPNSNKVTYISMIQTGENGEYIDRKEWNSPVSRAKFAWGRLIIRVFNTIHRSIAYSRLCNHLLARYPEVIQNITAMKWDLQIIDVYHFPCTAAIIRWTRHPHIFLSTSYPSVALLRRLRYPIPISSHYASDAMFDQGSWSHRLWYSLDETVTSITHNLAENVQHRLISGTFGQGITHNPSELNFGSVLSLYPTGIDLARSRFYDTVPVGGINCSVVLPKPSRSLQLNGILAKFVNDRRSHGTIIASFGHWVVWSRVDNRTINSLYRSFQQLPEYRFIWQYNGPSLPKADNVLISEWIPLLPLLLHHKTKALITHCRLKTITESLCSSVPIIAAPFTADQPYNARRLVANNLAVYLDVSNLSTESALRSIKTVLCENHLYRASVAKIANLMTDQPMMSQDLGIHWIEYTIRHRDHMGILRPKALQLNTFQLWGLDVISFVVFSFMGTASFLQYLVPVFLQLPYYLR